MDTTLFPVTTVHFSSQKSHIPCTGERRTNTLCHASLRSSVFTFIGVFVPFLQFGPLSTPYNLPFWFVFPLSLFWHTKHISGWANTIDLRSSPPSWYPPLTIRQVLPQVKRNLWNWRFTFPASKSMVALSSVTTERSTLPLSITLAIHSTFSRTRNSCIRMTSLASPNPIAWMTTTTTTFLKKTFSISKPQRPFFQMVTTTQKISADSISIPPSPCLLPSPLHPRKDPWIHTPYNSYHNSHPPQPIPWGLRKDVSALQTPNRRKQSTHLARDTSSTDLEAMDERSIPSVKTHECSPSKETSESWYVILAERNFNIRRTIFVLSRSSLGFLNRFTKTIFLGGNFTSPRVDWIWVGFQCNAWQE